MSDCNGAIDDAQAIVNGVLPVAAAHALLLDPRQGAQRAGRRRRLPPHLPGRGLQRPHVVLAGRGVPAQRHRRPAQLPHRVGRVRRRASAFANPTSRFVGHAVCDDVEWLNGLSNPDRRELPPQRRRAPRRLRPHRQHPADRQRAARDHGRPRSGRRASPTRWAAQQRRYAAADASIAPERFVAPDLSSAAARAAAQRAGVDLSSRASIDAADRAWSARQAAEHRAATR